MKEKNKFFKALGVGAVATLGLFTMAGCSLSDSEKADVMEGLENANTYMEETIDLLKEQNKQLKEQNDNLENYLEEVKAENAKITAEEAWNKLLMAASRFKANINGVRNNVRIIDTMVGENDTNTIQYYKTENNGYIAYYAEKDSSDDAYAFCFENDGKLYNYERDNVNNNQRIEEIGNMNAEYYGEIHNFNDFVFLTRIDENNLKSVEVLENGNYKISFIEVTENGSESSSDPNGSHHYYKNENVYEYILTSDGRILSVTVSVLEYYDELTKDQEGNILEQRKGVRTGKRNIGFEYGVITENYINKLLKEAKSILIIF